MYRCLDCGRIFEDPKNYVETHGFMCGPYEEWTGCPDCSGSYEEVFECDICGKYFTEDELTDGLCDSCNGEVGEDDE